MLCRRESTFKSLKFLPSISFLLTLFECKNSSGSEIMAAFGLAANKEHKINKSDDFNKLLKMLKPSNAPDSKANSSSLKELSELHEISSEN